MKTFLLFLALSLATSEKLDRSYLPPPGAKFSGGIPGDIQAPFEVPKETPLIPQLAFNNRPITPEDTSIEIGINRGLPSELVNFQDPISVSPGANAPIDYNKVPTTTTSYAFTQTTTHPPGEGFETTLGPINPITGFPITTPFNEFQTITPGFRNSNQGQIQQIVPGFQQPGNSGQQPSLSSLPGIVQYPGSTTPTPTLGSPTFFGQNQQGFPRDNLKQYQDNQRPGFTSGIQRPGFISQVSPQDLPQYQENRYLSGNSNGQINTLPSNIAAQGSTMSPAQYGSNFNKIQETSAPGASIPFPQGSIPPGSLPYDQLIGGNIQDLSQVGVDQVQDNINPGQLPSTFVQQGTNIQPSANIQLPSQDKYQLNIRPGTNIQDQRPGQNQYQPRPDIAPQKYSKQTDQFGRPIQPQPGKIFSTASPASPVSNQYSTMPSLAPQQYPTQVGKFGKPEQPRPGQAFSTEPFPTPVPNQYSTTLGPYPTTASTYPTGSFQSTPSSPGSSQGNLQNGLIPRPDRPQAETDRNAVILDYQSIITPEGEFSYTFDTSNGIHADESGTAIDGVKANGSYSYIGDDGKLYSVVYTADENGFQPRGDHLPTPPPIPEAIQKVIDQVNREKDAGVFDDGTYNEAKYGHEKYQSGIYRPQRPNQLLKSNIDLANKNEYPLNQENQNQRRPQSEVKRPMSREEEPQDYDETISEQDLNSGDEVSDNDESQPIGKVPSRRPVNRIPDQDEEKYSLDDDVRDNTNRRRPIDKIPSRHPFIPQNDSDVFNGISIVEEDDRRQPGANTPVRRPGQSPSGKRRPTNKIPARRPYDESDNFNTYEDGSNITDMEQIQPSAGLKNINIQGSNRLRPVVRGDTKLPISSTSTYNPISNQYVETEDKDLQKISGQQFDKNNRVVTGKAPLRVPGFKYNKPENDYELKTGVARIPTTARPTENSGAFARYNQNRGKPQVSTKYDVSPQFEIEDDFDNNRTTIPGKSNFDKNIRKPTGQRTDDVNRYATVRPSIDQETTFVPQSDIENEFDGTRVNAPGASLDQNIKRPGLNLRPEDINKFTTIRPIAQETTLIPQSENEYDSRTKFPGKTVGFDQKVRGPPTSQQPGEAYRYTTAIPYDNETGYQYIPPQRKFEQGSLFPENPTLQEKTYFERKGESKVVSKPFTTPDVTRGEETPEQNIDRSQGNRNLLSGSVRPSQQSNLIDVNRPLPVNKPQFNNYDQDNGSQYYNQNNENPTKDDNDMSMIPGQSDKSTAIGSTGRPSPSYQQDKQTFQPQQQFRPGTQYEVSQDITSGTSPILSQSTRLVTQPGRQPGIQGIDYYTESSQTPKMQSYDFVSTTRMPPQETDLGIPTSKDTYEENPTQSPYQTTYRPRVTIASNLDSEKNIPGSVRSGYHVTTGRPGIYPQNQVPSTTYRPGYFSTEKTDGETKPTGDAFGRPFVTDSTKELQDTIFRPGYAPERVNQNVLFSSSNQKLGDRQTFVPFKDEGKEIKPEDARPGMTKYGRPIVPSGQNQETMYYEGPSSTEKVIGEDFSGPKQQQRFDPERGYYY